ncbi:MAG: membrane dipeptidase [Verrucomicrobiales bacterium]|nr:membrane dipeptidase [Verrucomicrobiales bacterium]
MLLFDAHLDLSMNAIEWNRDLTRDLSAIRQREAHLRDKPDRGRGTVCLPELRRGNIRLVVATLIARIEHDAYSPVAGWASQAQAWAMTQGQRAWYRAMEEAGEMFLISDKASLSRALANAQQAMSGTPPSSPSPVGFVLSLEGADSILSPAHLERAYADGLRVIGPAHYGPGVYANGTNATGGFNARGRELLSEIRRLGMILDVTHLCDDCFWEALDLFDGPVWASHHNARALVPHNRQLSDEMIRALVQRDAVIGVALDAWMLVPGWLRGKTTPKSSGVTLRHVIDHIDHLCQVAGNARHVGIGSDLDGAFGTEQTPGDLDSIADLARLPDLLRQRGYGEDDLKAITHGNFIGRLDAAWR